VDDDLDVLMDNLDFEKKMKKGAYFSINGNEENLKGNKFLKWDCNSRYLASYSKTKVAVIDVLNRTIIDEHDPEDHGF